MEDKIKQLHKLADSRDFTKAQDALRKMIFKLPANEVISNIYLQKAYEITSEGNHPFAKVSARQLEAYCMIVRQILIENSEEFDRRVSKVC